MSRVAEAPRVQPLAYRPVDPVAAFALGIALVSLGALFSALGDWELQFNASYWLESLWQLAGTGLEAGGAITSGLLAQFAEAAYPALMDSMPVLMAAALLALFALGPSEIMTTVGVRSRES